MNRLEAGRGAWTFGTEQAGWEFALLGQWEEGLEGGPPGLRKEGLESGLLGLEGGRTIPHWDPQLCRR